MQGAPGSPLVEVIIGENESFEDALKRFKERLLREWAVNIGPKEQYQFSITPEESWLDLR